MAASFFFYDLETSGINPRQARVMQFAGQRTDLALNPIGEPVNILIKLTEDVLPDPDAVLVTGITPQATIADGVTEREFLEIFHQEVAKPDTIFVGYNTIRFDDEFMRCLNYRNFYDPYEWQWQDGRSRWDLLDVVRMTRALRPDGIAWPFDVHGKPTNRLELITALNKIEHTQAHDALSDVYASIAVARLIRNKHERLFEYLLSMRDKRKIAELVTDGQPFVYTSGRYPAEFEKTTVAYALCQHPKRQGVLVFDLRYDPEQFKAMRPEELAEAWRWKKDSEEELRLPVKTLQFNRCPAVAPLGVLDDASKARTQIDIAVIQKHLASLKSVSDWAERLCAALDMLEDKQQTSLVGDSKDVDACIYDGFFDAQDKQYMSVVRAAAGAELGSLELPFRDDRLKLLLPLYKARNFPRELTTEERQEWEEFCRRKLLDGGQHSKLAQYFTRLQELAARENLTEHQAYLLEDLRLYGESVMPAPPDL